MPVILSDETWTRIQRLLEDYENGVLGVIPGTGLKYEEIVTAKRNQQPTIKIGAEMSAASTICNPGNPPETGTYIFGTINGACQWINTTNCA